MKTKVALATLVTLLFAVMTFGFGDENTPVGVREDSPQLQPLVEAQKTAEIDVLAAPSAVEADKGVGVEWVRPGRHGDVYEHYVSNSNAYGAPPKSIFSVNDPLFMLAYVYAEHADKFTATYYLWRLWDGGSRLYYWMLDKDIVEAGREVISFGWEDGIGIPGGYLFFVKVETDTTADWRLFPLVFFTVQ